MLSPDLKTADLFFCIFKGENISFLMTFSGRNSSLQEPDELTLPIPTKQKKNFLSKNLNLNFTKNNI